MVSYNTRTDTAHVKMNNFFPTCYIIIIIILYNYLYLYQPGCALYMNECVGIVQRRGGGRDGVECIYTLKMNKYFFCTERERERDRVGIRTTV